ncbi:MAG: protease complex subunit PrcB family protein [Nitrospira sp.]|nr:protease complex subunit PrcB family protein [Nitrospira sp.]
MNLVFETIARGVSSRITVERFEVIREQNIWDQLWALHAGYDSSAPIINFHKEHVIVAHLGGRSSSGYEVRIIKIEKEMGNLAIHYEELKPGLRCIVAQVITHPYHIIKMERSENNSLFIRTERILDC